MSLGESLFGIVLIALLIFELKWRARWLRRLLAMFRVLLAVFTAYHLVSETGLNAAMRRSLRAKHPINFPRPPSKPPRLATEFESGIVIMFREAQRDLTDVVLPTLVLTWLAISPVIIEWASNVRVARRRKAAGESAGSEKVG